MVEHINQICEQKVMNIAHIFTSAFNLQFTRYLMTFTSETDYSEKF